MKIVTYNINGLRPRVAQHGSLLRLLNSLNADIICFQETKITRQDLSADLTMAEGYDAFVSCSRTTSKNRGGYSGVATFCRVTSAFSSQEVALPVGAEEGFTGFLEGPRISDREMPEFSIEVPLKIEGLEEDITKEELLKLDGEGRCVITDHGHFEKMGISLKSRTETHCCREGAYTCFSQRIGAEEFNYGSRIDHILIAGPCIHQDHEGEEYNILDCHVADCDILTEFKRWNGGRSTKLEGSDHIPVYVKLTDIPDLLVHSTPALSIRYVPEVCGWQQSIVEEPSFSSDQNISEEFDICNSQDVICSKKKGNIAILEWQRIQERMKTSLPLCKGHREPCVARSVKKGSNIGRLFYVCARAQGPASNPEANCNHFQWAPFKSKEKK